MTGLPPPNPAAGGLFVTDAEWEAVQRLVAEEPLFLSVRIYGSRLTGRRGEPVKSTPPDIDLACEVAALEDTIEVCAGIREKWSGLLAEHNIDLEWIEPTGRVFAAQMAGRLLRPRAESP